MKSGKKTKLIINEENEIPNFLKKEIKKLALSIIPQDFAEVQLNFVGKKRITEINTKIFNKKNPTDVITLTYPYPSVNKVAEVFICTDIARENSRFFNLSYECELLILITHSFLHLKGIDDKKKDEFKKMSRLTLLNLKKLL
ncbi:MAG: rRNA maturation RNase YbeY [Elusimicrobiales bacterium]